MTDPRRLVATAYEAFVLITMGAHDDPGWTGEWLGQPTHVSSFDPATNRELVTAAGSEILEADVVDTIEPEGVVAF